MRITRKTTAPIALAAAALIGLSACGSDDPVAPEPPSAEAPEEEAPEETPEEEAPEEEAPEEEPEDTGTSEDEDEDTGATGAGGQPAWANPVTEVGDPMGTIELGDITVDVYRVGVDQSTRSSIWADPDTNEPIVAEGDDVVILNYVVTNNGEPITMTYGLIEVGLSYDTWPFMQQPSVADHDLLESYGVNDNAVATPGEETFVLGTGESFSVGQVMLHQPGEAYTIEAEHVLRDDAGERLGDSVEGELTGTME